MVFSVEEVAVNWLATSFPGLFGSRFYPKAVTLIIQPLFYQYMTGQETILARRFSSSVEESIESTPKIFTHFLLKVKIKIF